MNQKIMYKAAKPAYTIGRTVNFFSGRPGNPRTGEGSFARLKNGSILSLFSEFYSDNDWSDRSISRISGTVSEDEGETWSDPFPVFEIPDGYSQLMCASLLRLADGDLAALYLARIKGERDRAQLFFARCKNELDTWHAVPVLEGKDITELYHVLENDRLVQLKNGRLIFPTAFMPNDRDKDDPYSEEEYMTVHYSDDGGETWFNTHSDLKIPFIRTKYGLQEPGIIEMPGGKLRMWARTGLGCQYECYSDDNGETWSVPTPMEFFKSPLSPMMMKDIGGMVAAVYNPEPFHIVNEKPLIYLENRVGLFYDRTPLALSVSDDGGKNFCRTYLLEDDPYSIYSYPAIFDGGDYILVSYYHSNRTDNFFNSMKTVKITKEELKKPTF